jgi:hypothetical protein
VGVTPRIESARGLSRNRGSTPTQGEETVKAALVGSRKRRITSILVGAFAAMALAAVAYFAIGLIVGEGETNQKLGTATEHREVNALPLTVKLDSPVEHPGDKATVEIIAHNTTSQVLNINSFSIWTTNTAEGAGCSTAWFKLKDTAMGGGKALASPEWEAVELKQAGATFPFPASSEHIISDGIAGAGITGANWVVEFTSLPEVDQDPCEGATLTVHAKVTTTNETH